MEGKKWNGYCKEFKDDKIIFEGKYMNGKRWEGTGKEYDSNNKLIFDGNYIKGKKKIENKKKLKN